MERLGKLRGGVPLLLAKSDDVRYCFWPQGVKDCVKPLFESCLVHIGIYPEYASGIICRTEAVEIFEGEPRLAESTSPFQSAGKGRCGCGVAPLGRKNEIDPPEIIRPADKGPLDRRRKLKGHQPNTGQ